VLASVLGCASDDNGVRDQDGTAGSWQDDERGAGASLGSFEFTYYWVASEAGYNGSHNTSVYNTSCTKIATVKSSFWNALKLEGTGKTDSGQLLNYAGSCGCARSPCFKELGADKPWGEGVQGRALEPFRSIAVDKDVIPYGSWMYIPQLDGETMPGDAPTGGWVHDGCVQAADTGSAINGDHIDFFVGLKGNYLSLIDELGLESVTVHQGGTVCTGAPPQGGDDGGDDGGGDEGGDDGGNDGTQVCFLGADGAGNTCLPLSFPGEPAGYDYPAPLSTNYRQPIAYLDLQAIDGNTKLAPNFKLNEFAQASKGRYAVVQPHAIARMQQIRSALGSISINSGYRSPGYNAGIDGSATSSRHMFGDGFDFAANNASLTTAENKCEAVDGFLVEYTTHVHCDWRNTPVDAAFFGSLAVVPGELDLTATSFGGELVHGEHGWSAPASGFDEGEPLRRWTALDADGTIVAQAIGELFVAPPDATRIEVLIGAVVRLSADLE
jgi:3D (Asp-Asp-Asp) domain-containing protein